MFDFAKGGAEWNVSVAEGDDVSLVWGVLDEDGNDFDWTGCTVTAETQGSQDWSISTPSAGLVVLTLSPTKTTQLGEGTWGQKLKVVRGSTVSTWLAGNLKVRNQFEAVPQLGSIRTLRIIETNMGTLRLGGCIGGTGGGGGGGDPTGAAGGVLSGTYPNPGFLVDMATQAELDAGLATKANTSHAHAAADITSGVIAPARLGTGTTDSTTTLRGDGTWVLATVSNAAQVSAKQTAQLATTSVALANITGLAFFVTAGHRYYMRLLLTAQSAAATTGAGVGFSAPAMTAWKAQTTFESGVDGTGYHAGSSSNTPTSIMLCTNVDASNDPFAIVVEAWFTPSASGTVQLRGSTEVNASAITFLNQGVGFLHDADGLMTGAGGTYAIPLELSAQNAMPSIGTKYIIRPPFGMDLTIPVLCLAQGGSGVTTVDIQRAGVSILSPKLTIDAGERSSYQAATPAVLTASAIAADDELTVVVTGVASGSLGLFLYIVGVRNDTNIPVTPPLSSVLYGEDFDTALDGSPLGTDNTTATLHNGTTGVTLAADSDGPNDGTSNSMHVNGTAAETLRWDLPTHTTEKGMWYYEHESPGGATAWMLYVWDAAGTTVAYRFGVNVIGQFVCQQGIAGPTDTANFSCVVGNVYRIDDLATAAATASFNCFNQPAVNNAPGVGVTDTISVALVAAGFSDHEWGLNVALAGGSTIPANMTDEGFNGTNGVQITQLNTSADNHTGSGSCTFDTTYHKEGTSSMRVHGTTFDICVFTNPSHTHFRASHYFRYVTPPGTQSALYGQVQSAANVVAVQFGINISGQLFIRNSNNGTGNLMALLPTALTTATEYRVEHDVTASGVMIERAWRGVTLDSALVADAWQSVTSVGNVVAANFGDEWWGLMAAVATAPDFNIDRIKTSNAGMPSPVGTGSGTPAGFFVERIRFDTTTAPTRATITIDGGGGGNVSATLRPPAGMVWFGATTGPAGAVKSSSTVAGEALWRSTFGRRPDIISFYRTNVFDGRPSADEATMIQPTPSLARAIAMYAWKVNTGQTMRQIADGASDSRLLQFCQGAAEQPHPFLVRLQHEFDPVPNTTGNTAADYADMFRHCVDYIRNQMAAAGKPNQVIFVWNPTGYSGNAGNNASIYNAMYPGDAWVDWIAMDPYFERANSRADFRELMNENAAGTAGWSGFYNWAATTHPTRPVMLAEWGVNFLGSGMDDATAKARTDSVATYLSQFPNLAALVHWNVYNAADFDARQQGHGVATTAFATLAANAAFQVGTSNAP